MGASQAGRGGAGGKLRQAEPRQAECRPSAPRDRAREIVGRAARRTNDDYFGCLGTFCEESRGGVEPRRRGG